MRGTERRITHPSRTLARFELMSLLIGILTEKFLPVRKDLLEASPVELTLRIRTVRFDLDAFIRYIEAHSRHYKARFVLTKLRLIKSQESLKSLT